MTTMQWDMQLNLRENVLKYDTDYCPNVYYMCGCMSIRSVCMCVPVVCILVYQYVCVHVCIKLV